MSALPDSVLGMDLEELSGFLEERGEPAYRGKQMAEWLYGRGVLSWKEMTNLPKPLTEKLDWKVPIPLLREAKRAEGKDGTTKLLFRLRDGLAIESVMIPAGRRRTLCLSTQVGCPLRCRFCATGRMGFKRDLSPGEIVEQVLRLRGPCPSPNLVFMGMGEPFLNYDNCIKALRVLQAVWGLGIAARKITVSTLGVLEGIRKFAKDGGQVRLSLSLHSAVEETRRRMLPFSKKVPLSSLRKAVEFYVGKSGRKISIEVVLLEGINDAPAEARAIYEFARGLAHLVNLIPFNPAGQTPFRPPSRERQKAFKDFLRSLGVRATLRRSRGADVLAACGQLGGIDA